MEPLRDLPMKHKLHFHKNGKKHRRYVMRSVWRCAGEKIKKELKSYCDNTSLHGFRYITAYESNFLERLIWLAVCLLGFVLSIILMLLVWQRFTKTPTVTTIDTTTSPIRSLPFPSVTICNYNKIYKPEAEKLAKELSLHGLNVTEIENFFISLPTLVKPEYITVDYMPALKVIRSLGITIDDLMHRLMQPCDKLLVKCAWLGHSYDCQKLFKIVKSIEGLCCSFNYHAAVTNSNVTLSVTSLQVDAANYSTFESTTTTGTTESYPGVNEIQIFRLLYPNAIRQVGLHCCQNFLEEEAKLPPGDLYLCWRNLRSKFPMCVQIPVCIWRTVPGAGRDVGLSVVLDMEGSTYAGAVRSYVGASVLIHDPVEYPDVDLQTAVTQPSQETAIILSASVIESMDNVRNLDLSRRNCWFEDETILKFTVEYSYQSCVAQCRIEHILNLCNCIPFYYPTIFKNVRTCDLTDVRCMRTYRRILSSLQTPIDTETTNRTFTKAECSCLPQCSDKSYTVRTETATLASFNHVAPILKDLDTRNLSLIYVYFRDITCLKYRREILMSWDNLLASFGGIFGLCLGGSFVSLVEILYYFTIKIFHRSLEPTRPVPTRHVVLARKSFGRVIDRSSTRKQSKLENLGLFRENMYMHRGNN